MELSARRLHRFLVCAAILASSACVSSFSATVEARLAETNLQQELHVWPAAAAPPNLADLETVQLGYRPGALANDAQSVSVVIDEAARLFWLVVGGGITDARQFRGPATLDAGGRITLVAPRALAAGRERD